MVFSNLSNIVLSLIIYWWNLRLLHCFLKANVLMEPWMERINVGKCEDGYPYSFENSNSAVTLMHNICQAMLLPVPQSCYYSDISQFVWPRPATLIVCSESTGWTRQRCYIIMSIGISILIQNGAWVCVCGWLAVCVCPDFKI
jgi:hypothetical protein